MFLHYLGKHEFRKLCLFSHAVYRVLKFESNTALAWYIFDTHQPI